MFASGYSDHQALEPARLQALVDAVTAAIEAVGDGFEMPYEAVLLTA